MTEVAVLIPVLARPERARQVADSLAAASPGARPTFLVTPGDDAELAAVRATGADYYVVPWPRGPGDYPRKINAGFRRAVEAGAEWCFLGADDLAFHAGWLEAALGAHARTGACVVGTNDKGNLRVMRGLHSTHSLVHADYLRCGTVDEAGLVLHEGYDHQFTDDELVQTAVWRGTFTAARDSVVEHLHPHWRKAEEDGTYAVAMAGFDADRLLYYRRRRMWGR